ncbi:hypothetical protein EMIT051CA3_20755 [Pseudomonas chlororaphis]
MRPGPAQAALRAEHRSQPRSAAVPGQRAGPRPQPRGPAPGAPGHPGRAGAEEFQSLRINPVGAAGRRSIARDGPESAAFIQSTLVIVNVHREQARSYKGPATIRILFNQALFDRVVTGGSAPAAPDSPATC